MRALNERQCPVCGSTANWSWRVVIHRIDGERWVHFKGRFGTAAGHIEVLASLLINGKRVLE